MIAEILTAYGVRRAVLDAHIMAALKGLLEMGAVRLEGAHPIVGDAVLDAFRRDENELHFEVSEDVVAAFVTETAFCRIVDSFLTYLREILHEIALVRPEVLKGKDTATFEQILEQPSRDDLLAWLAETKVEKLAQDGYQSLVRFLKNHLGTVVFVDDAQERRLGLLVGVRNLYVHRRGVVDHRFVQALGEGRLGERYPVDWAFFRTAMIEVRRIATAIDVVAVNKFGVPGAGAGHHVAETE